MSPGRNAFERFIGALMVVAFVFCLTPGVAALAENAAAGKNPPGHDFKDPYDGGMRLPAGGGEPGGAYLLLLDAAAQKDSRRICGLMATDENELAECLKDEKLAEGIAVWLGDPNGQKILDGYSKDDEATLDVAYPHAGSPDSYASVRMLKAGGKWIWAGVSASGSGEVSAAASGTVDFSAPVQPEGPSPSPRDCPMLGKWEFFGKDDTGETWTGVIFIRIEEGETACDVNIQGPKFSSGVGGAFACNPDQKSFSYVLSGNSFTADLSEDGRRLTNGKWTTKADDFMGFPEVNGTWSATSMER